MDGKMQNSLSMKELFSKRQSDEETEKLRGIQYKEKSPQFAILKNENSEQYINSLIILGTLVTLDTLGTLVTRICIMSLALALQQYSYI